MDDLVADLQAEAAALDDVLTGLDDAAWLRPTPAEGWDVRDTVTHLAASDDLAYEGVTTGRSTLVDMVLAVESLDEYGRQHLAPGRALPPAEVHAWWRRSNASLVKALAEHDPAVRIPWGPNHLSLRSFVTARLMETWAHGLDILDSAGVEPVDTDRLRHVADIGWRALPYAFAVQGQPAPGAVRLELVGPSGTTWTYGDADAPTVIRGAAGDWCRVAVHRNRRGERDRLRASGPDADAVLQFAQAYLSI